jgi:hypothetical protein
LESESQLIWGVLFGGVGLGYFLYGKKQRAVVPLVAGISLFIFPYFVSNMVLLVITGMVIIAVPWFVKI